MCEVNPTGSHKGILRNQAHRDRPWPRETQCEALGRSASRLTRGCGLRLCWVVFCLSASGRLMHRSGHSQGTGHDPFAEAKNIRLHAPQRGCDLRRVGSKSGPYGADVSLHGPPAAASNDDRAFVRSGGTSKAVNQTFHQTTTINGAENQRQAARIMESAFGNMHSLALQNAQSATV